MILLRKNLYTWIVPLALALLVFALARPALAEFIEREIELSAFLASQNVEVGRAADEDGNSQIYYVYGGNKVFVTDSAVPHIDPVTDGKYIAWSSQLGQYWQIFLYHIPSDATVQLTATNGNNVNPRVAQGRIVWEGQAEGTWQIFLYDSGQINQLTQGEFPSINLEMEGNYATFSQLTDGKNWKGTAYDISREEFLSLGLTKHPLLKNGHVFWQETDEIKSVIRGYNLAQRQAYQVSGEYPASGLKIVGNKVKWWEDVPPPPEPEETGGGVAGSVEPVEPEETVAVEKEIPVPEETPDEENAPEPAPPVTEEEVAEELGLPSEPVLDEGPVETIEEAPIPADTPDEPEAVSEPESAPPVEQEAAPDEQAAP
ncbi:MAG: hypothetical protein Q8P75_02215 [bacterium]|nr:hypothetical protein [bacterium]